MLLVVKNLQIIVIKKKQLQMQNTTCPVHPPSPPSVYPTHPSKDSRNFLLLKNRVQQLDESVNIDVDICLFGDNLWMNIHLDTPYYQHEVLIVIIIILSFLLAPRIIDHDIIVTIADIS